MNVLSFKSDQKGCKGVKQKSFGIGLQCFKYAFLIAIHRPHAVDGVIMIKFDKLSANGGGEGSDFPKVHFNCLNIE